MEYYPAPKKDELSGHRQTQRDLNPGRKWGKPVRKVQLCDSTEEAQNGDGGKNGCRVRGSTRVSQTEGLSCTCCPNGKVVPSLALAALGDTAAAV